VDDQPENISFRAAVLDMGSLFKDMKRQYGVPPSVTMDIVRLQMMFMQQNNQAQSMNAPLDPDTDVNEVISGEDVAPGQLTVVPDDE
jgi:hypothetical protein